MAFFTTIPCTEYIVFNTSCSKFTKVLLGGIPDKQLLSTGVLHAVLPTAAKLLQFWHSLGIKEPN